VANCVSDPPESWHQSGRACAGDFLALPLLHQFDFLVSILKIAPCCFDFMGQRAILFVLAGLQLLVRVTGDQSFFDTLRVRDLFAGFQFLDPELRFLKPLCARRPWLSTSAVPVQYGPTRS
jgi:hypothetical protein